MLKKRSFLIIGAILICVAMSFCAQLNSASLNKEREDIIKPYSGNRFYWQYGGKPILLIGATDNDNLFQNQNLNSHLDSLKEAGGNYVRNTMSDRDTGDERAYFRNSDGKYDLTKWNGVYWEKFEELLKIACNKDIIVQIEIWDRFDHSREPWLTDPYNPGNNINYSFSESGLDEKYPNHPGSNTQPFFYSVPALENNELLLRFQKRFVDKLLSISLKYGNILYCIDNETSGREEWASFWADYIKKKGGKKEIYITEMWDDWNVKAEIHKRTIDHPGRYSYVDLSQNSHITGYDNWKNARNIFEYISENPRPVNSVKIYGSDDERGWRDQGKDSQHAIQTFFRNLIGGFASGRFHRPPHGLGLGDKSMSVMKTVRKIETKVKFWEMKPCMDLLVQTDKGDAYISANKGESYLIYFANTDQVRLDLRGQKGDFILRWIDVNTAKWTGKEKIERNNIVDLSCQKNKGKVAVIKNSKGN